jgi:hypothetical protein
MYIYHYTAYEETAMRSVLRKYVTRKAPLDDLLLPEIFVALFADVKLWAARSALR